MTTLRVFFQHIRLANHQGWYEKDSVSLSDMFGNDDDFRRPAAEVGVQARMAPQTGMFFVGRILLSAGAWGILVGVFLTMLVGIKVTPTASLLTRRWNHSFKRPKEMNEKL